MVSHVHASARHGPAFTGTGNGSATSGSTTGTGSGTTTGGSTGTTGTGSSGGSILQPVTSSPGL